MLLSKPDRDILVSTTIRTSSSVSCSTRGIERRLPISMPSCFFLTCGGAAGTVHHFSRLEYRCIHEARRRVLEDAHKPRESVLATPGVELRSIGKEWHCSADEAILQTMHDCNGRDRHLRRSKPSLGCRYPFRVGRRPLLRSRRTFAGRHGPHLPRTRRGQQKILVVVPMSDWRMTGVQGPL